MSVEQASNDQAEKAARGGPWAHVAVSAAACLLTVSIVGSGVFLVNRLYSRYTLMGKIREFLGSLENRSKSELEDSVAQLSQRPKLVEQMLPELGRTLRAARSDQQLCAVIAISRPFLAHRRIRETLFELRADGRECVAAGAVGMLGKIEPAEQAANILGRCLEDVPGGAIGPAALDRICAGLYQLEGSGLKTMKDHGGKLSADRRIWLVGYVNHEGGPNRRAWLETLARDGDSRVRSAAESALRSATREADSVAKSG